MKKKYTFYSIIAGLALVLGTAGYNLGLSGESAYEKIRILVDIIDQIQNNYVESVEVKDLVYGAATGLVRTLDPFSQFLPPEALKEMKVETEGEFGGIGIRVAIGEDSWLTVVTPLPGTPAFRAGVFPRDRIVKIDGSSTEGITIEKAVQKLRGKPGAKVTITVWRPEEGANGQAQANKETTKDFTLTREVIKIQTIYSRMLSDNIGYVRITEFNARTPQDIHEMLSKLGKEGMQSLVLDLRFNPGGLLPSAIETTKEFIGEDKVVVYTQGRKAESRVEYRAGARAAYGDVPLVVLINEGSASGSEILAGALQDHKRAVLVGARSFGKASVQSVVNLSDGSGLRLTTAYYYTPNGRLIHKKEFKRKKPGETANDTEEEPAAHDPIADGKQSKESADKNSGAEEKGQWGIEPDIAVNVDRETAAKIYQSFDVAYFPDKPEETKPIRDLFKKDKAGDAQKSKAEETPKAKTEEPLRDVVLDRAIELLKARKLLLHMAR
ncbi:MAG: S41 family peptidase [Elusimicrobia bacterium]|nr:S41 family peptidase [Elusimicrobiota bacterium]